MICAYSFHVDDCPCVVAQEKACHSKNDPCVIFLNSRRNDVCAFSADVCFSMACAALHAQVSTVFVNVYGVR